MYKPFNMQRYMVHPGRRLALIFGFQAKCASFDSICSTVEGKNAKVLHWFASTSEGKKALSAVLVLDITDCREPIEEIGKELESSGLMSGVGAYASPVEGFVADVVSHPIFLGSSRIILLRDLRYRELVCGLQEWFGPSGSAFLYHVGFRIGMGVGRLHRDIAEKVGLKDPVQIYKYISAPLFQLAGFGVMEVEELEPTGGVIVVRDSFECELRSGSTTGHSQFARGIIAGALAEVFGHGFNVVEEECIAMGAPACRLRVRTLSKDKPIQP